MGDDDKRLDLLGRIDCSVLYQPFVEKLNALLLACRAREQDYVATSGLRTYDEQDAIYAIGRTVRVTEHIKTNAPGGYSPHNFGVACDLAPHLPDFPERGGGPYEGKLITVPDGWKGDTDPYYAILGEEAKKLGLEWGGDWSKPHDTPHVQLPLKSKKIDWATMRAWYAKGGMVNVFKELDARSPW